MIVSYTDGYKFDKLANSVYKGFNVNQLNVIFSNKGFNA